MTSVVKEYQWKNFDNTPPRVGHFEKVSLEQFKKSIKDEFGDKWSDEEIDKFYDNIQLPKRATVGSSGYDFRTPIPFELKDWEDIKIPTGIRVRFLVPGWWLMGMPRSGLGFKHFLRLGNTIMNVDSDYFFSDNEGHIFAKVRTERGLWYKFQRAFTKLFEMVGIYFGNGVPLKMNAGDSFIQAVFSPYGITDDDEVTAQRNGGFGSTDR